MEWVSVPMRVFMRIWFFCASLGFLLCVTTPAHAWIFPEHARITEIAFTRHLDAEAQRTLQAAIKAVQSSKAHKIPNLCDELSVPIVHVGELECTPLSTLPALAGDHARDETDLLELLRGKSKAPATLANEVSRKLVEYLSSGPSDARTLYYDGLAQGGRDGEADDDARRMFIRKLDVYLDWSDKLYRTRAEGSRSHFQDPSATLELLLQQAQRGNLDNALAQALAHHMRSLQLARRSVTNRAKRIELIRSALLEHAFALHFVQDAFASGHIGTSHSITDSEARLRRHDYLNRVGLPITRATALYGCNPASTALKTNAAEHCWIAYGDGYLDATNADKAADAVARFSMQLALALDNKLATRLMEGCSESAPIAAADQERQSVTHQISAVDQASETHAAVSSKLGQPEVLYEGQFIMHMFPLTVPAGRVLHVEATSRDFDVFLSVRLKGHQRWVASQKNVIDTDGVIDIPVTQAGDYEIRVGSATPNMFGQYTLHVEIRPPGLETPPKTTTCSDLDRAAELLDPRPAWMLSKGERLTRQQWSSTELRAVGRAVIQGAENAVAKLCALEALPEVHADVRAAAETGRLPSKIIGRPFNPCAPDHRWAEKRHPMCEIKGTAFRFDAIETSLLKPLLASWPGPTGSVRTVRGDDAFGFGLAAQTAFGGGLATGLHPQVPMALAGSIAAGLAFRFDRIIPGRLNREVVGLNVGLAPVLMMGMNGDGRLSNGEPQPRYTLSWYLESRTPLLVLIGIGLSGTPWNCGNWDFGPTGGRMYFTLPSRAPGEPTELFAWDVEVLNFKLKSGTASRTSSIGAGTDLELRFRAGMFMPKVLDPGFAAQAKWVPMFSLEVSTGYSLSLSSPD